jgi:bleomycin hydrolase
MALVVLLGAAATLADNPQPIYRDANEYPVLDEIIAARESQQAVADSLQAVIDQRYADEAEAADEAEQSLRVDFSGINKPSGPEAFGETPFYFPPSPQYYTGTCWAFCSTSFLESEVARLHGKQVKLSEMFTVYWAYVEKARRFVREQGHSVVAEGGQDGDTIAILYLYGAVPAESYRGILNPDGSFDHTPMDVNYTPRTFCDDVLQLDPDAYVSCVSTMTEPFYTYGLLDVTDNWRREENYFNLPLEDFYKVIRESIPAGYTVTIGGDNSEPGLDGLEDCAVIPSWDIPAKYIDQGSREFRIDNGTTGDDHGIHVVGYKRIKGVDWFLIKDSNRSSRLGTYQGYYFFTGDYIRLKMLNFLAHKDRLEGLLP